MNTSDKVDILYLVAIGPVVSEEKSFEIVDGRMTEPACTISSPGAFGSGELKKACSFLFLCVENILVFFSFLSLYCSDSKDILHIHRG